MIINWIWRRLFIPLNIISIEYSFTEKKKHSWHILFNNIISNSSDCLIAKVSLNPEYWKGITETGSFLGLQINVLKWIKKVNVLYFHNIFLSIDDCFYLDWKLRMHYLSWLVRFWSETVLDEGILGLTGASLTFDSK